VKFAYYTNLFINGLDLLGWRIHSSIMNPYARILARLQGVELSKGIFFYGKPKFKKARSATITIGKSCTFRSKSTSNLIGINRPCILSALTPDARLSIGNNSGFSGTVIGCFKEIRIGDHVKCGANTLITDSDWHSEDPRSGKPETVIIENNVWLGVNVTVLKGITIGENSVIGAGSVVTKSIPPNVIAAGNPCKVIKPLNN
jgi:acetyltransferase-like isoleucine patch superfamily enzyme